MRSLAPKDVEKICEAIQKLRTAALECFKGNIIQARSAPIRAYLKCLQNFIKGDRLFVDGT
jgi:hypothetical protein